MPETRDVAPAEEAPGALILSEIWRHPVKSLRGEALSRAFVEEDGLAGDRGYGILDLDTGKILTARREPLLLGAGAHLRDDGTPLIELPGGVAVESGPEGDEVLSTWLGHPVHLGAATTAGRVRAESFTDPLDEASPLRSWELPEGRFVDAAPILLLTTATLRAGRDLHPEGAWEVRRFRPNLVVDAPGTGWLEDAWPGLVLALGEVELEVRKPCVRCVVVTRQQPGLPRDLEIFRSLSHEHGAALGVLCGVRRSGALVVGDEVRVLDQSPRS